MPNQILSLFLVGLSFLNEYGKSNCTYRTNVSYIDFGDSLGWTENDIRCEILENWEKANK